MIFTPKIKKAIRFATKTHEVYQKQKRKGKDIPYITHPLGVGLILARANASEDVVIAGILHDTIEDSTEKKKVTREMLTERFGNSVAELVASVTEERKDLPWEQRKRDAREHIKHFSHDSLLLKAADLVSNASDLLDDYADQGSKMFERFNAPKEKLIENYRETVKLVLGRWPENPLAEDLNALIAELNRIERTP
jgi:(p)ppGpp synthase/HD superfamily hydrolase